MLHFNGLEPIDFKGKLCEPKVDNEKKLRLANVKFATYEQEEASTEVLCSCFDDDYARDFIRNKLSTDDKQVLATYLRGGETAINNLSKATDGMIEKYVQRAVEEGNNA